MSGRPASVPGSHFPIGEYQYLMALLIIMMGIRILTGGLVSPTIYFIGAFRSPLKYTPITIIPLDNPLLHECSCARMCFLMCLQVCIHVGTAIFSVSVFLDGPARFFQVPPDNYQGVPIYQISFSRLQCSRLCPRECCESHTCI